MKAVLLSAGQGSRLLPLTADRPKCLLRLGACTVLEWQLRELGRSGIDDVVVVLGFKADEVEAILGPMRARGPTIRTVLNPFYQVADNLSTCWMARHEMRGDFLLVNGDTVFEAAVVAKLLAEAADPVTIAIDRRPSYDADDMRVSLAGGRLRGIGKHLAPELTHGESIGMTLFRGAGSALFTAELERRMRRPEALEAWYTCAIDALAKTKHVGTVSIEGLDWTEIDFPADLERAGDLVQRWAAQPTSHSATL